METNDELTGILDEVEEGIAAAAESLACTDDAMVRATAPAVTAYIAEIRKRLAELEADLADRLAE